MDNSPVRWLTDHEWATLPISDRALIIASVECDVLKVHETGPNRSPRIDEYLKSAFAGLGQPWCAAFVWFSLLMAGWRTNWKRPSNPASVYSWMRFAAGIHQCLTREVPKRGDLALWCSYNKKRKANLGHIFFVTKAFRILGFWFIETIEGNSNEDGSREGVEVIRRKRRWSSKMWRIDMAKLIGVLRRAA